MKIPCTIKYYFSFIFLCGIFLNSQASITKSDSLFAAGKYFEASVEYERLIFQAKSREKLNYYKYRKSLCYKNMKEFGRALDELQPIYFSNPDDSLYRFVCYQQALCFFLTGEPARALWKIDEYFHRSSDSTSFRYFMPVRILALNETYQWAEARKCFLDFVKMQSFSPEEKVGWGKTVEKLYSRKSRPNVKSVSRAENLSRFIPGSGQIYAGKAGEGIVNFLINASVLTFAGIEVYHGFYITGYLAGLGFFNKTYHGGIKRAGILASQRNREEIADFNRQINQLFLSDFDLN